MAGLLEKRKQKIVENAAPHLEPGEQVRAIALGQTRVPAALTIFAGFLAKVHAVAVTERNVYAFRLAAFSPAKIVEVAAKHPIGSVQVQRDGRRLVVGDLVLNVLAGAGKDADGVASAAGSGSERQQAA